MNMNKVYVSFIIIILPYDTLNSISEQEATHKACVTIHPKPKDAAMDLTFMKYIFIFLSGYDFSVKQFCTV